MTTAGTRGVETSLLRRVIGDWRFPMVIIIALALVPRAIYLLQIRSWPFFLYPILDSRTQYKWAIILVDAHWIGNKEVTAKAPLYTYFLAVNHWVFEEARLTLFSARLVQLALGAVTCGLVYLVGFRVFGKTAGVAAGVLCALYSPGVYRDGQLLDTPLATFLATCLALALLKTLDEPRPSRWLGCGLLLGLLGLARPNLLMLLFAVLALIGVWLRKQLGARGTAAAAGALVLGTVLPILPITARNYLVTGHFIPISSFGGMNLYTGNNPDADGYSPVPSGIAWERTWYEAGAAGAMHSAAQDAYWRNKTLRFWRQHPGKTLFLLGKKVYLFWQAYEIPNNVSYEWGRERSSVLRLLPLTFAVVGPLGLLGVVLGGWRTRAAWTLTVLLAAQVMAVAIFFVCGRYRMPAVPLLCVFSGFAAVELLRLIRARRWGPALVGIVALAAFAAVVNSDPYGVRRNRGANRDWFYLGQSYMRGGATESAREVFQRAVEQDPEDADAFWLLGHTEVQTGRYQEAAEHLKRALDIAPDFTLAAVPLAELHLLQGWPLDEPERLLRQALEHQPNSVRGITELARLNIRRGDLAEARENILLAEGKLSVWARQDTRSIPLAAELSRVRDEARAAGVDLPERF